MDYLGQMELENQLLLIFLGGLVKKNSGNIEICGIDIDKDPKESRKKIGIVPQELNIDPFFTPIELLDLQAGLIWCPKKR